MSSPWKYKKPDRLSAIRSVAAGGSAKWWANQVGMSIEDIKIAAKRYREDKLTRKFTLARIENDRTIKFER